MKLFTKSLFFLLGVTISLTSCFKDEAVPVLGFTDQEFDIVSNTLDIPKEPHDYTVIFPNHLKNPDQQFFENNFFPTEFGLSANNLATLGRVLFYDTKLSKNNTVSCATCHDQRKGFADGEKLSKGFKGELTKRNSLALATTPSFNSSYENGNGNGNALFGWDESHHDLQSQSSAAITSDIEMGLQMHEVVEKLADEDYYQVLFKKSFGTDEISEGRILNALASFVNSISAVNTKFDLALLNSDSKDPFQDFPLFSDVENLGKNLFMTNCSSCHGDRLATVAMPSANNGLDLVYEDKGIGEHLKDDFFAGVFKVPFLRNIGLTAPYMHDGRFETLSDVVDHYSDGIQAHDNLSPLLRDENGTAMKMNFNANEKAALVSFLETLTDEPLMTDVRFSDPFKS